MGLSPAGRKKIAHQFIGGYNPIHEMSPARDERNLSDLNASERLLSPLGGASRPGRVLPTTKAKVVGYFRASLGDAKVEGRQVALSMNGKK